jgi:hypothetical protein
LLTLKNMEEYETVSGKIIEQGDVSPGVEGEMISGEEVVKRLATVVMGEDLRMDEKKGKTILREGALEIVWPA